MAKLYELTFAKTSGTVTRTNIPRNHCKVRYNGHSKYIEYRWFLGVADTNDVIQKIEKTLNNTHTTTQKLTNNSFRNTKKHPEYLVFVSNYSKRHVQFIFNFNIC